MFSGKSAFWEILETLHPSSVDENPPETNKNIQKHSENLSKTKPSCIAGPLLRATNAKSLRGAAVVAQRLQYHLFGGSASAPGIGAIG